MRLNWQVTKKDAEKVQAFLKRHEHDAFVRRRIRRNLKGDREKITKPFFWHVLVSCLLTTQQRSGPESSVTKLLTAKPFPLNYRLCLSNRAPTRFSEYILTSFGGIRWVSKIAKQIEANIQIIQQKTAWADIRTELASLEEPHGASEEREVSEALAKRFKGIGTKQSRNLLQGLGLTQYEIPIDSRITKWLNDFGFPIKLSSSALSDWNYYNFISDGFQHLCQHGGVLPCVLDAAIFSSFDDGKWENGPEIW